MEVVRGVLQALIVHGVTARSIVRYTTYEKQYVMDGTVQLVL